jgi:hypothetical protein
MTLKIGSKVRVKEQFSYKLVNAGIYGEVIGFNAPGILRRVVVKLFKSRLNPFSYIEEELEEISEDEFMTYFVLNN